MPLTGGVVTMMFTDIVGSTAAKAAMGDHAYLEQVLSKHNQIDPTRACHCAPATIQRYLPRVSGPLLDRTYWA
jgi:hypothetical protein